MLEIVAQKEVVLKNISIHRMGADPLTKPIVGIHLLDMQNS